MNPVVDIANIVVENTLPHSERPLRSLILMSDNGNSTVDNID